MWPGGASAVIIGPRALRVAFPHALVAGGRPVHQGVVGLRRLLMKAVLRLRGRSPGPGGTWSGVWRWRSRSAVVCRCSPPRADCRSPPLAGFEVDQQAAAIVRAGERRIAVWARDPVALFQRFLWKHMPGVRPATVSEDARVGALHRAQWAAMSITCTLLLPRHICSLAELNSAPRLRKAVNWCTSTRRKYEAQKQVPGLVAESKSE